LDGAKASHLAAVASNDDFFAIFGKIEKFSELVFGLEGAYLFHKKYLILS
jgi:hypothetical protein